MPEKANAVKANACKAKTEKSYPGGYHQMTAIPP